MLAQGCEVLPIVSFQRTSQKALNATTHTSPSKIQHHGNARPFRVQ